jgi:hypothetical protein
MSTAGDDSDSLLSALTSVGVPVGNHKFIRQIVRAIGIAEFRVMGSADKAYVKATRRDGQPALHIAWGYTNGFASEEEVVRTFGAGADRGPSTRKGTWYVAHPITRVRPSVRQSQGTRREAGFCNCGMQLTLTGVCDSCD